jgi:hypothetical protein
LLEDVFDLFEYLDDNELPTDLKADTVSKMINHLNVFNGYPMSSLLDYLMSGRDCEMLQMNLENYPFERDSTFNVMSEDLTIKCW